MERIRIEPRSNWMSEIEKLGFDFYTSGGVPYWTENAYYRFTLDQINYLEATCNKLHQMCLYAVDRVVNEKLFPLLGIDPIVAEFITESWRRKDPQVYGRFDLIWDGKGDAKLLEYNADTPTSLFEASIVQWNWREQRFPKADQWNSIHEEMTDRWAAFLVGQRDAGNLYVTTAAPCPEDETTVQYIGQCARDAGYQVTYIPIQDIGWNGAAFLDLDERQMLQIFKLYPWEWMFREEFGKNILKAGVRWWEPPWKMILSNKGILPILWEMYPEHPSLLPAYRDPGPLKGQPSVRKPLLGREGANIEIYDAEGKTLIETPGAYDSSGYIYQGYVEAPTFNGNRPNLGVWMVGDGAYGMGVREDTSLIISNRSRFVPHIFE